MTAAAAAAGEISADEQQLSVWFMTGGVRGGEAESGGKEIKKKSTERFMIWGNWKKVHLDFMRMKLHPGEWNRKRKCGWKRRQVE